MSFLGSSPPKAQPLPEAPTIDDARENVESRDKQRRRRGRATAVLSSDSAGATGATVLGG